MTEKTKLGTYLNKIGLKQVWIAEKTGIHSTEISRIVSGRINPTEKEMAVIAEVLNVSVSEIF